MQTKVVTFRMKHTKTDLLLPSNRHIRAVFHDESSWFDQLLQINKFLISWGGKEWL